MRCIRSLTVVLIAAVALTACALLPDEPTGAADLGPFPTTYRGTIPCADCPGIRYQLNLYDNHTYFLRRTYLGEDESIDDAGRWRVSDDGGVLILRPIQAAPTMFEIREGGDSLRMLDVEGEPIESELSYELRRR